MLRRGGRVRPVRGGALLRAGERHLRRRRGLLPRLHVRRRPLLSRRAVRRLSTTKPRRVADPPAAAGAGRRGRDNRRPRRGVRRVALIGAIIARQDAEIAFLRGPLEQRAQEGEQLRRDAGRRAGALRRHPPGGVAADRGPDRRRRRDPRSRPGCLREPLRWPRTRRTPERDRGAPRRRGRLVAGGALVTGQGVVDGRRHVARRGEAGAEPPGPRRDHGPRRRRAALRPPGGRRPPGHAPRRLGAVVVVDRDHRRAADAENGSPHRPRRRVGGVN